MTSDQSSSLSANIEKDLGVELDSHMYAISHNSIYIVLIYQIYQPIWKNLQYHSVVSKIEN